MTREAWRATNKIEHHRPGGNSDVTVIGLEIVVSREPVERILQGQEVKKRNGKTMGRRGGREHRLFLLEV